MRRYILIAILLALPCLLSARQKVKIMIHWIPQTQFAGYYVAFEKGFYAEEGLDVELIHPQKNVSVDVMGVLHNGKVDFCTGQLIQGLISKSSGLDLCNVLQTSQNSGLMCVSHTPLTKVGDLSGKKIGRWKSGFGELADMMAKDMNLDIKWIEFQTSINLFVSKAIDATLCYSYSEYLQLLFAKGEIPIENTLRFSDFGYNYPEDALFTTSAFCDEHRDIVDKIIRATIKGWNYARDNREEALEITCRYMKSENVAVNHYMQKLMLDEVLALQINDNGLKADFKHIPEPLFDQLCNSLLDLGYLISPVNYKEFVK